MRRLFHHIKVWNRWRKHSLNSKIYKLQVLFNVRHSPTFMLEKGCNPLHEVFERILNDTRKII